MNQFKEQPLEQLLGIHCFTVWMFHGGIILSVPLEEDLLCCGLWWDWGLAYLLFCAAYWSRQPRVFQRISRSCWLCSHHRIITKFSGVLTNDRSDVHAKSQGQRSKVKVTDINTQLNRFGTVTPVWIAIWWWNDAYSLMLLRRGALLFFKVIHQISRSHRSKIRRIWPRLDFSGL